MPQSKQRRLLDFLRQPIFFGVSESRWRISTWWPSDSRQSMQHSLLRLLALAQRQNLDSSALVGNLAEEHRGQYRRLLRRLARRLSEGTPLVSALEQTPDVLSEREVLAIRFASQTGTLGNTYEQLLLGPGSESDPGPATMLGYLLYPAVLSLLTCGILSFLAIFIFPVFERVSVDAGLELPVPFQALLVFLRSVNDYWPLLALVMILLLLMVCSSSFRQSWRRFTATHSSKNAIRARTAELLVMLATASQLGRPIRAALSTLARYHFDPQLRNKLLFVSNEVEQGADVWMSLAAAKLLTQAESDAMGKLSCNESRIWAMRRLAAERQEQVALNNRTLATAIEPACVLVVATIVLWICVAIIGWLSDLIFLTS